VHNQPVTASGLQKKKFAMSPGRLQALLMQATAQRLRRRIPENGGFRNLDTGHLLTQGMGIQPPLVDLDVG
jgi:hypothetical protein